MLAIGDGRFEDLLVGRNQLGFLGKGALEGFDEKVGGDGGGVEGNQGTEDGDVGCLGNAGGCGDVDGRNLDDAHAFGENLGEADGAIEDG